MATTTSTIVAALLSAGLALANEAIPAIESKEAAANDAVVAGVVGAIVTKLPTSGIAGLVDGQIKPAIIASEPELETLMGTAENDLFAAVENAIKAAAAK